MIVIAVVRGCSSIAVVACGTSTVLINAVVVVVVV